MNPDSGRVLLSFDPRAKLLVFLASGAVSVSMSEYSVVLYLALALVQCALLFLEGKRGLSLAVLCAPLLLLLFRACVEGPGTGAPGLAVFVTGLLSLMLFSAPLMGALVLLVKTTKMSHLVSSLQAMHLPMVLVIPLAALVRFVPTVREEWVGVRKAMAFRGISMAPAALLRSPLRSAEYLLVPLLFSSLSVMEELAAASLARGLDSESERSSLVDTRLSVADWVVIVLMAALIAGCHVTAGMVWH